MDLPPGVPLSIEAKPAAADAEALAWSLEAYNEAAWPGHQTWQELGLFLRDAQGRILGGLTGATYAGWLSVQYFWLSAPLRGGGIGAELIALAERKAVERGCHSAYLDTFGFQAPEFYARLGYQEFGRLPYPPRGERIFLRKTLVQPSAGV